MASHANPNSGIGSQESFRFEAISKTYLQLVLRNTCNENQKLRDDLAACTRQLYWERQQHSNTYSQMQQAAANHMQEVCQLHTSLAQAQQELETSKEAYDRLVSELVWARGKLYLIDELVDVMRLEEEGQKNIDDRSMQITDMILGLETTMENRYRRMLQGKDNEITRLAEELRKYEAGAEQDENHGFDLDTNAV
ncbi:hypothetical protein BDW72DRAFT_88005 [Aspergillus terricola var. indicus]